MNRKFRLLKKIELSESIEVWSIFEIRDDRVIVDWCWSMSAEWFIKHWYIEEVKIQKEINPSLIFMKISPYINYIENWYIKIDSESIKKEMDGLYLNNQ